MKRLNLRLLEVFRAVFEARSVTEAAAALNITQPAASKCLRQLEAELGVSLFNRAHGRLSPTADGQWLYTEYSQLWAQIRAFEHNVSGIGVGKQGKLRIAAVPTLAASLVARAAARFARERPQVSIDVMIAQFDEVVRETALHRVDLGLTHSFVRDRNICSEQIGETEIVAVLPADHPLARVGTLTAIDLAETPIIIFDPGSPPSHFVREVFDDAGVPMNVVMQANSAAVAAAAAAAGMGIALIDPWPILMAAPEGAVMRPFAPRIPLKMSMIHSAFRPPSTLAIEMCAQIRELLAEFARLGPPVRAGAA